MVQLPDGRRVRCRGLRDPVGLAPDLGVYLLGKPPAKLEWPSRWVRWPDFWLPADDTGLVEALCEVYERAGAGERVEVACRGGRGRTGTALGCLVQLTGVPAAEAVAWVRHHYHPRAIETPWQRRYVRRFSKLTAGRKAPTD